MEAHARKGGYDILAVQESRLAPSAKLAADGYKVFRQEAEYETSVRGGVLFLVANHLAVGIVQEKSNVANQLWIRLTGAKGQKDMYLCSAYLPQESAPAAQRSDAFKTLSKSTRTHIANGGEVVILGDLNSKTGSARGAEEQRAQGAHCEPGARSGNGKLLLELLKTEGLVSLGGQAPPPASVPEAAESGFWWTRLDKSTQNRHTLDYVLVTSSLLDAQARCWVDYTDLNSDHRLIGADIRCPREVVRCRGRKEKRRRFKTAGMIQRSSSKEDVDAAQQERARYQACLGESFTGFGLGTQQATACECVGACVCLGVEDFVRRTMEAMENSVGSVPVGRKFSRSWFDDEVKQSIADRREAYAVYLRDSTQSNWDEFLRQRRVCNKLVKAKKREDWQKFVEKMEKAFHNDHLELWRLVRRLSPSGKKVGMEPVRNKDGVLAESEEQILEAWGDHQEKLGTPTTHALEDSAFGLRVDEHVRAAESLTNRVPDADVDKGFTLAEVKSAVDKLDYHKAGTADRTVNTMFKCGGDVMARQLQRLFNWLRDRESLPPEWQRSTIVNLFKEGDKTDPGNYKGIALISCLGKLYLSLWASRLANHAEKRLCDGQGGFRARRSTVDQALTLSEVLLRRKRAGKDSYLCFVDFRKAFDTVWHNGLWKRMWDSGIRGKAWRVVRNLYSSINAQVRVGHQTTRSVRMRQGVHQGCPLSPILSTSSWMNLHQC